MKLEAHNTPSARHFGYCRSFVRLSHNLLLVKNDQGDERVYEVVRQVPMVHERDHSKKKKSSHAAAWTYEDLVGNFEGFWVSRGSESQGTDSIMYG
ncbi:Hypothetical protein conserved in the Yarrowia clade [Yarrowia lipolytica]|nr:Hypothetical protein conserved in the Yarrowia clade [Yarrowia lipolytica]